MSGSDSISNPVARRISYTGSYPSARGSAPTRLGSNSAWLMTDDVAGGSHYADVSADMACQLCMLTSQLCHADVILIRVSLVGRVIWYSGRVCPSGRRRRVASRGQPPLRRVLARAGMSHVRIFLPFSPVALSLPPLHSGMVKTPF